MKILGIINAVVLLLAFLFAMAAFVAMAILCEEDPERAKEIMERWFQNDINRHDLFP